MNWWSWIIAGLVMLMAEMFAPTGFVLFVVGISFISTGLVVLSGITSDPTIEYLICSGFLVLFLFVLRKKLLSLFGLDKPSAYTDLEGEKIEIKNEISPGAIGEGELRGTRWKVKNTSQQILKPGEVCKVLKIDGLTVEV